jgi:hypothetical protein
MRLNPATLQVDIRVQDRYRKWFSQLGLQGQIVAGSVILGDSDVDYELAPNIGTTRVLGAPYNVEGIKSPLIYNGVGKNLAGVVKCFVRKITTTGDVQSLYDYPNNENWSTGILPPTLVNGKNWEKITFDDTKMGYILYFSTVLDYYFDDQGNKKRLSEIYDFTMSFDGASAAPTNWEYIIDNENGSILISKGDTSLTPVSASYLGKITVTGQFSKKIKEVKFNF